MDILRETWNILRETRIFSPWDGRVSNLAQAVLTREPLKVKARQNSSSDDRDARYTLLDWAAFKYRATNPMRTPRHFAWETSVVISWLALASKVITMIMFFLWILSCNSLAKWHPHQPLLPAVVRELKGELGARSLFLSFYVPLSGAELFVLK